MIIRSRYCLNGKFIFTEILHNQIIRLDSVMFIYNNNFLIVSIEIGQQLFDSEI